MPRHATPLAQRFWAKVDVRTWGECWPWQGKLNGHGYGLVFVAYRPGRTDLYERAHRIAYRLTYGVSPALLRHCCDYPACCNPLHLEPGTQAQNLADMWARGRGRGNPWQGPRDAQGRFTSAGL